MLMYGRRDRELDALLRYTIVALGTATKRSDELIAESGNDLKASRVPEYECYVSGRQRIIR